MNTATYMMYTKSLSVRDERVLSRQKTIPMAKSIMYAVPETSANAEGAATMIAVPAAAMKRMRRTNAIPVSLFRFLSQLMRMKRVMQWVIDTVTVLMISKTAVFVMLSSSFSGNREIMRERCGKDNRDAANRYSVCRNV